MIPDRYNKKNLKHAIGNPEDFIQEISRIKNRVFLKSLIDFLYNGENFLDKDWDNLIILDACRPDFFEDCNPFEGEYSRKTSLGASSNEFFIRNMVGKEYYDTVYVTGNTSVQHAEKSLHRVIKTYANKQEYKRGWLPEATTDAAIQAYEEHPHKRIVIHFMQPHTPYLGDKADKLRKQVTKDHNTQFRNFEKVKGNVQNFDQTLSSLVEAYELGYISQSELHTVYKENLELVFDYVSKLLNTIDGKTVITSDHSESLGEFNGISTHEDWAFSSKLREVPWLVIDKERRETYPEPPVDPVSVDEEIIRENLSDLGYL